MPPKKPKAVVSVPIPVADLGHLLELAAMGNAAMANNPQLVEKHQPSFELAKKRYAIYSQVNQ